MNIFCVYSVQRETYWSLYSLFVLFNSLIITLAFHVMTSNAIFFIKMQFFDLFPPFVTWILCVWFFCWFFFFFFKLNFCFLFRLDETLCFSLRLLSNCFLCPAQWHVFGIWIYFFFFLRFFLLLSSASFVQQKKTVCNRKRKLCFIFYFSSVYSSLSRSLYLSLSFSPCLSPSPSLSLSLDLDE